MLNLALALLTLAPQLQHGVNPSFHGPSSVGIVLGDAFTRARPGQISPSGTRLFSGVEIPGGEWVVEWTGSGSVRLDRGTEISRSPGRAVYRINASTLDRPGSLFAHWTGTASNIHVWLPGSEDQLLYAPHAEWIKELNPHALRMLDLARVNFPNDGPRISTEQQVALCNRAGVGLHFQIPYTASDEWIVAACAALRALRPELPLSVEFSNEMWNALFPAYGWLDLHDGRRDNRGVPQAAAREINRVFAIFERELGARAKHFVGGHLQNPWFMATVLSGVTQRVDACGPATYMHPRGSYSTGEAYARACEATIPGIRANLAEHARVAAQRGADLWIYEAGQHPDHNNSAGVVEAAQRTQTMGNAYRSLATMVEGEGARLIFWYSMLTQQDIGNAAFGAWESTRSDLPKGAAIRAMMAREDSKVTQ